MRVTCYSVLKMVVDSAVEELKLVVDEEKEKQIIKVCEVVDKMSTDFDGISYNVIINNDDKNITIELDCDEIIVEDNESEIYDVFKDALNVTFKHGEGKESLIVSITVPGIWK